MVRKLIPLALVAAVAAFGAQAQAAPAAKTIQLVSAKVSGSVVTVTVKIVGWKMYPKLVGKKTNKPDGGHWHIYVDGKYNNFSANPTTGKTLKLKAGKHKIRVELANDDHSDVAGTKPSRTITVSIGRSGY